MTKKEFKNLKEGEIIKCIGLYQVAKNINGKIYVVEILEAMKPEQWEKYND